MPLTGHAGKATMNKKTGFGEAVQRLNEEMQGRASPLPEVDLLWSDSGAVSAWHMHGICMEWS